MYMLLIFFTHVMYSHPSCYGINSAWHDFVDLGVLDSLIEFVYKILKLPLSAQHTSLALSSLFGLVIARGRLKHILDLVHLILCDKLNRYGSLKLDVRKFLALMSVPRGLKPVTTCAGVSLLVCGRNANGHLGLGDQVNRRFVHT